MDSSILCSYIEHDDGALHLNVVAIAQSTEFLLTSSIPDIEAYGTAIGMENQWMQLDTQLGDISLYKFTGHVTFNECRLTGTTIADREAFECGNISFLGNFFKFFCCVPYVVRRMDSSIQCAFKLSEASSLTFDLVSAA